MAEYIYRAEPIGEGQYHHIFIGELVRCGECKHRYLENDVWVCQFGLMIVPNGFCNYGERRADDGNS